MKALEIKRENRYDSAFIMRQVLKAAVARVEERNPESVTSQRVSATTSKPKTKQYTRR